MLECDEAFDLWQKLELASELESDIGGSLDWERKQLLDCNAGKNQLIFFEQLNNTGAIDVKDESVLEKISSFKMLSLLNWIGAFHYLYC